MHSASFCYREPGLATEEKKSVPVTIMASEQSTHGQGITPEQPE